jgi:hypothetical protein
MGQHFRVAQAILLTLFLWGCGGNPPPAPPRPEPPPPTPAYPISVHGGTPATGPGERFNHCERIWCTLHEENFFIDHFAENHMGYVLHDAALGDVFVLRWRTGGPDLSRAGRAALFLCGRHVHPWVAAKHGGTSVRHTGFNPTLGYDRAHFQRFGTRLDPCCVNGLGHRFLHSDLGKQFRFHDLAEYRAHPEIGWQKPFAARVR